jgi:hypothetical protein
LALAFPAAAGSREGFYIHYQTSSSRRQETDMNQVIKYRKPIVVDLGTVLEVIRGTLIKGHRGIIEVIHWYIIPAYDLDE